MKALVGTFNQEKALAGACFVIVKSSRTFVRALVSLLVLSVMSRQQASTGFYLLNEITAADKINVHIMLAAVWSVGERGAGHCVTDCGGCHLHRHSLWG